MKKRKKNKHDYIQIDIIYKRNWLNYFKLNIIKDNNLILIKVILNGILIKRSWRSGERRRRESKENNEHNTNNSFKWRQVK